ncbi:hypothetical protein QBC33DRAFT_532852 [Phialemonium atrogriseum]|uniref:Uncharacterized protein n=1 Tax=Phialemonium atrogriseum TaxID=1093897 RepID=A0AAJ0C5V7_9PEZI|nr:uncharacterized protein QBC33DRAFT_532852 [Phialemonium atrogriseum]KAK1769279.1 hypothetical protein QBC33DRAFT_532852 [Phialemonium atrogriseum]
MQMSRLLPPPIAYSRSRLYPSFKEADTSFSSKIERLRPTDAPTLVVESGYSKSLRHLRADASWWLQIQEG